jgi:prepilin peptidase CpaA
MTLDSYIYVSAISALLVLLAIAALSDLRSYRIPNKVTLLTVAVYPIFVLSSPVPVDWLGGLMVGGAVLGVSFSLFVFKVFGGGDAKMLAAVSLWAGPALIFDFLVFSALAGGMLALFWISPLRHGLALTLNRAGNENSGSAMLGAALPYGVAISAGGVVVAINLLSLGRGV